MISIFFTSRYNRGFSLPELLVSIAIVAVISSIVLSNQAQYTEGAALTSQADEIGLLLSQAQIYGISVREFTPGSEEFNASYGLSFNTSPSGSNKAYLYWADRGGTPERYDSGWDCPTGAGSECISKTTLSGNNVISELCYIRYNGPPQCQIGRADISFKRPNPQANIHVYNQNGNYMDPQPDNMAGVRVKLVSPSGLMRTVSVYKVGQISVQ